jgi:hypothetical protein
MRATLVKIAVGASQLVQGEVFAFVPMTPVDSNQGTAPGTSTWQPAGDKAYPLVNVKIECDNQVGGIRDQDPRDVVLPIPWRDITFTNNGTFGPITIAVALSPAQADSLPDTPNFPPQQLSTNANNVVVLSQAISGAIYDVTSGGGAPQDTGPVTYTSTDSSIAIECNFSVALTGSRTMDPRKVRTDGSQFSLMDGVRNGTAPFALAIGRLSYYAAMGMAVGSFNSGFDHVWGWPLELGGASGIRANLTAGGAETARIRILERRQTAL